MKEPLEIVILGLSITSSWGNGHATTYRGLVKGLAARGHRLLFLERNAPWYAENRDQRDPQDTVTAIYEDFDDLVARYEQAISNADLVIVGSYVPEGIRVGTWAIAVAQGRVAFYDIDTPVTMSLLEGGKADYISADLIRRYDAYFSFCGGPTLRHIEAVYGSPMARPLYCTVDQDHYRPVQVAKKWDLGYLGTYSLDRQGLVDELISEPAHRWAQGKFVVVGPQYPEDIIWPENVQRIDHLSPGHHPAFYAAQQFTLNVTREAMKRAGYSPSVRLFEAGACGVPIISDWWEGLDSIFAVGTEVLVAATADEVLAHLRNMSAEDRKLIAASARSRVLAEHSPVARARQIESYMEQMDDNLSSRAARGHGRTGKIFGRTQSGMAAQS